MICLLSSTERVQVSRRSCVLQRVGELWPLPSEATQLGLHELDIESDGDLVANENAASLEGSVPGQSEVLAINLRGRRDRNSGVAPWIPSQVVWALRQKTGPCGLRHGWSGRLRPSERKRPPEALHTWLHNSQLSDSDDAAIGLRQALCDAAALSEERKLLPPQDWAVQKFSVDGVALERWCLKTLITITAYGEMPIGSESLEIGKPSRSLVETAFGRKTFQPPRAGLHWAGEIGDL